MIIFENKELELTREGITVNLQLEFLLQALRSIHKPLNKASWAYMVRKMGNVDFSEGMIR